jgi:hypothetical protein
VGEGDWKNIQIEDPNGRAEKRTASQIMSKWREVKYWAQSLHA